MSESNYRIPPYSEESEHGVLGSIMIDSQRVLGLCAEKGVSENSFYVPAHRHLYGHILSMQSEMMVVDLLTVGKTLTDASKLDQIGGHGFLERTRN
jgi:replicative DNA helicase